MFEMGTIIENRYQLIQPMGDGGFSKAFLAKDLLANQKVVLKFPDTTLLGDPAVYERFRRETFIGKRLKHPDLPMILAVSEESQPYLVMTYIEGEALTQVLKEKSRFTVEQAVFLVANLLETLDYCHRQGIYHRDIKPGNLIMGLDGHLKLIDFGIALIEGAARVTWRGFSELIGTPEYMAPEQIKGERGNIKSDIYSTGCLLYHLLSGTPPFAGDNPITVMYQHMNFEPQPLPTILPEIHPGIWAAIRRAMRRNEAERYDSTQEMVDDLRTPQNVDLRWIDKPNPPLSYTPPTKQYYWIISFASIVFGIILASVILLLRLHK